MRKLKTTDVFAAMRLIKAAGVKNEVKKIALMLEDGKLDFNQKEIGVELVLAIIEGLAEKKSEDCFYEFLAGPFEMEKEEVANLDLDELIRKFKELGNAMDEESWKGFFKSLANSIK